MPDLPLASTLTGYLTRSYPVIGVALFNAAEPLGKQRRLNPIRHADGK
jgi:hypothetical protein